MARCERCGLEGETYTFGDALAITHGSGSSYCERCVVEEQLDHALERAQHIEELRRRLQELGGPAERLVCGFIWWTTAGAESQFGQFCILDKGHGGPHQVDA